MGNVVSSMNNKSDVCSVMFPAKLRLGHEVAAVGFFVGFFGV